ncbi:MAG: hypothetical protein FJ405_07740, partial [Verrucomicrobia bacterium]|nr:hypothetical protein [Verrucomicrobiota bacterium]
MGSVMLKRCIATVCCAGINLIAAAADLFDYPDFLAGIQTPPKFQISLAAGAPMIRFPMFACFDDAGRLYVAESSGKDLYAGLKNLTRDCRVSRLEDTDGDGRFEKSVVFAQGVTVPMGLAWRGGRLYLADPPELVALTDTDGDGHADRREVILRGFGHTDNGSLHGLTFGPDARLYFTMGEPDGWKLPRGDGTFLEGVAGALFRCQPDGSQPEVISRGFVNLVEVEFLPGGEIIGTDNWFQVPAGGHRDALVDCAPGGLFPYAPDRGTPLPRTGLTLPPVTLLPAVAHSGLTRLRRTGFPAEWRGSLFVAEHNTRKVVRQELRRDGSTFAAVSHDFVTGAHPDFHPADVLEAPDGSLLIVDTGGWYVEHCPTGRIRDSRAPGGIYRVRGTNTFGANLEPDEERFAALWRMREPEVRARLGDTEIAMVCAAVRVLAARGERSAGDALAALLDSPHAPVRRAAAEGLAVCGVRAHSERLAAALAAAADDFERHACAAALLALADEPFVRSLLANPSPQVRRAALHLLDQAPFTTLQFPDLPALLADPEPSVSHAARQLLTRHPEWARHAVPWLRQQFASPLSDTPATGALESLLVAFQSNPEVRRVIGEFLQPQDTVSTATRAWLLNRLPEMTAQRPDPAWLHSIPTALASADLRAAALKVAAAFPEPEWEPLLASLAVDSQVPVAHRLLAARLAPRRAALGDAIFALAVDALDSKAPVADRLAATDLLARATLTPSQLRRWLATWDRGMSSAPDAFLPPMARAADDSTRPLLGRFLLARLRTGWTPPRATLEEALRVLPDGGLERSAVLAAWDTNRV